MSGGTFDYIQYEIARIADEIDIQINKFIKEETFEDSEVIHEMQRGVETIRKAAVHVHEIDYLIAGDNGEQSFLKRLASRSAL